LKKNLTSEKEGGMEVKARTSPNILITGTPGTGKSTLSSMIVTNTGLNFVELGKLVKEKGLHDGYDQEFDTFIFNEDKVSHVAKNMRTNEGLRRTRRFDGPRWKCGRFPQL
jgi:replication-associated recombination protein RarA